MSTTNSNSERLVLMLLRLSMAWVFLYAASHQVFVPGWSIAGFLKGTKTFNGLFAVFTGPGIAPVVSFLVGYGHLLIGLSLLVGLMVRASALAGIVLMILYWMAHMDFPYISNTNNLLVDSHIVYALVLWLMIVKSAGHVWGLDGWASKTGAAQRIGFLGWATA